MRGRELELRNSYERIRDLGARLLNAQESERARIARELHDDISQQMALLQIDLELLGGTAQGDAVAMADDAVNRAQDIARSVHELSHRLHPAKLRLIGLVSALQGLQREMSQSGAVITFTHDNRRDVEQSHGRHDRDGGGDGNDWQRRPGADADDCGCVGGGREQRRVRRWR